MRVPCEAAFAFYLVSLQNNENLATWDRGLNEGIDEMESGRLVPDHEVIGGVRFANRCVVGVDAARL